MLFSKKRLFTVLVMSLAALLVLSACAPAAEEATEEPASLPPVEEEEAEEPEPPPAEEEEVMEEEMEPELGSEERPLQILFVPSVEAETIIAGGEVLSQALLAATGLHSEVDVPTSYAATIEAMCASPADTIGFIPALGYILANNRCGVEVGMAAVRRGLSWYATAYFVPVDSDFETLADLEGATWAFPDPGSTSGFAYPSSEFGAAGVEVGDQLEAGGHGQAVTAVYNGEADVGTAFFSPTVKPDDDSYGWTYGDDPEPWDADIDRSECFVDEDGRLLCGEYRVLDARLLVTETAPDIMEKVRILAVSAQIPNDTVSFGPDFPPQLRAAIIAGLVAFSKTDAWNDSLGAEEFYGWTALEAVDDSFYDPVRNLIEQLGWSEEDIFS